MAVKIYSKKKYGDKLLSKNFTVREFACNDGSNTVKIDTDNVIQLQKIRDHFDKSIKITSGYRTPSYNKKIGGASSSYHTKGMAADIVVSDVDSIKVAMYAESIGCKGVIWYPIKKFTHIDTRSNVYHAICINNVYYPEPTSTLKQGDNGVYVKWLQFMLKTEFGFNLAVDGDYGNSTKNAIINFQKKYNLTTDGVFGTKTKSTMKKEMLK